MDRARRLSCFKTLFSYQWETALLIASLPSRLDHVLHFSGCVEMMLMLWVKSFYILLTLPTHITTTKRDLQIFRTMSSPNGSAQSFTLAMNCLFRQFTSRNKGECALTAVSVGASGYKHSSARHLCNVCIRTSAQNMTFMALNDLHDLYVRVGTVWTWW